MIDLSILAIILSVFIPMLVIILQTTYRISELKKKITCLCKNLKSILDDVNPNNEEELYDIDSLLQTYFQENSVEIQRLINEINDRPLYLNVKRIDFKKTTDFLKWLFEFYAIGQQEEERIRIWSQNIDNFHTRLNESVLKL